MKKLFLLFASLLFLLTLKIQAQTENQSGTPIYAGLGVAFMQYNLDKTVFNQTGTKLAVGEEGRFAMELQYQFSSIYGFFGYGIGIRPLAKKTTRFQPMIYSHFGATSYKSTHYDTIITYQTFGTGTNTYTTINTDINKKGLKYSFFTIIPEISLDYFIGGRFAAGIFINKSFIINNNPYVEYENKIRKLKGNTSIGLVLKFFFFKI